MTRKAQTPRLLPHQTDKLFLTDGGLETTLVFHDGIDLPCFAAFDLLRETSGRDRLYRYFRDYALLAREQGLGFVLETMTWRGSADWGEQLGYSPETLRAANQQAIELMQALRDELETGDSPMLISGCIGPRGDGYLPDQSMTAQQAQTYHATQIETLRDAGADFVSAMTLPTTGEAIGMVRAAAQAGIPIVISFTVETDGRLPDGQSLQRAIETVDRETGNAPAFYMINCAHPTHFSHLFDGSPAWAGRIGGVRANASCKSHEELDACETLDDGNPVEFGEQYHELRALLPSLRVLGGCCGTDLRHVGAICSNLHRQ